MSPTHLMNDPTPNSMPPKGVEAKMTRRKRARWACQEALGILARQPEHTATNSMRHGHDRCMQSRSVAQTAKAHYPQSRAFVQLSRAFQVLGLKGSTCAISADIG